MSTPAFDPEAIARRVVERQRAQAAGKPPERPRTPMSSSEGSCITGGDDNATHVPLPPHPDKKAHDPFVAIEAARERSRVRSPFGDHPTPPPRRTTLDDLDEEADELRFVAPELEDELVDIEEDQKPPMAGKQGKPTTWRSAPRANQASSTTGRAPVAGPANTEERNPEPAQETRPAAGSGLPHDPRCGQPLTGGGAPRGWVLMRIVGAGTPRRYCSTGCARAALVERPTIREPRNPNRVTTPRQNAGRTTIDAAEVIRRYRDGQTIPAIADQLGHTRKALRAIINTAAAAGQVDKRDDRSTHSGGQPKSYDQALVERVRRLYTLHRLTQEQVAEQIGTSAKVVQNIMARHDIEARPAVTLPGHTDHGPGVATKQRIQQIADAGATVPEVRAWAAANGIPCGVRGTPAKTVVDAYLAAHNQEGQTA